MRSREHVVTLASNARCADGSEYKAGQVLIARPISEQVAKCISLSGGLAGQFKLVMMDEMAVVAA